MIGLRYFADPGALLRPLRELLVPGGRLVVIEAVRPPRDPLGAAAGLYFFEVAPRLGADDLSSRRRAVVHATARAAFPPYPPCWC